MQISPFQFPFITGLLYLCNVIKACQQKGHVNAMSKILFPRKNREGFLELTMIMILAEKETYSLLQRVKLLKSSL